MTVPVRIYEKVHHPRKLDISVDTQLLEAIYLVYLGFSRTLNYFQLVTLQVLRSIKRWQYKTRKEIREKKLCIKLSGNRKLSTRQISYRTVKSTVWENYQQPLSRRDKIKKPFFKCRTAKVCNKGAIKYITVTSLSIKESNKNSTFAALVLFSDKGKRCRRIRFLFDVTLYFSRVIENFI